MEKLILQILGGAVVLILSVYNLLKDLFLFHVEKFPQGPLSLPIVGNVHLLNPKTPHFSLEKMVKKYGSIFSLRMGHVGRMVFLHDIHHINQVSHSCGQTLQFIIYDNSLVQSVENNAACAFFSNIVRCLEPLLYS